VILEDHERAKFVAYLRQCIESDKIIIEQFSKMSMTAGKLDLAKMERVRCMAKQVVADWLGSATSVTVTSEDVGG
jgi:hypothetical protein